MLSLDSSQGHRHGTGATARSTDRKAVPRQHPSPTRGWRMSADCRNSESCRSATPRSPTRADTPPWTHANCSIWCSKPVTGRCGRTPEGIAQPGNSPMTITDPTTPTPHRRWLQLSLRTVLMLTPWRYGQCRARATQHCRSRRRNTAVPPSDATRSRSGTADRQ